MGTSVSVGEWIAGETGRLILFTGLDLTRDSINRYMTEHR
jgi:hypothetical protein